MTCAGLLPVAHHRLLARLPCLHDFCFCPAVPTPRLHEVLKHLAPDADAENVFEPGQSA